MLFHGEYMIKSGTATDTKIRAVTENMPTPRGNMIPHVRNLYIEMNISITDTKTKTYLLNDYLLSVFSSINIKLNDGSMLYKTTNSRILKLLDMLYYQMLDDWDIQTTKTTNYFIKFPIPFNYEVGQDRPDYTYLYPADEFEEIEIPINTTVSTFTTNTFNWYLIGEIIWLDRRFRSPVRTWFNKTGSADEVTLPVGKYHMAYILNAKGADANRYDSGLYVTSPNYELKGETGEWLQQQWHWDLMTRNVGSTTFVLNQKINDIVNGGIDFDLGNVVQPIVWGKKYSVMPQDGILGPMTIRHVAADPDIADIFVLQTYG